MRILRLLPGLILLLSITLASCKQKVEKPEMKIIFLHHSTGGVIWNGGKQYDPSLLYRLSLRISKRLASKFEPDSQLPLLFGRYNSEQNRNYSIEEINFPKSSPYGWHNYPFDYYNIWVRNEGENPFMEEPTLEILTKDYQVIIFKHCFPVSNIQADQDSANINSDIKTISNYKLQYSALREKLHQFPDTKFILFTGAAQVKANISEDEAIRAREFFNWVINEWDLKSDNIFLWDLYSLQTDGGLYFKDEYAVSPMDSHPGTDFASRTSYLLFERIIDIIENNGNGTQLTGEKN